jgi:flagellar hook assembly protein FlgD
MAEPRAASTLHVADLQVTPTRSEGRTFQITYTLTREATLQVIVTTLTGQAVSWPEREQTRAAGLQQGAWQAVDEQGRPLPPGVYLLRVEATDDEGQQTSAIRTVTVR